MSTDSKLPLRVLHLEFNKQDREIVRESLQSAGIHCSVRTAETRAEFVTALAEEKFDLILSDLSLPNFDGMTALDLVRENHPQLPYIFVSGSMGEDAAIESLKNGATDYVLKHRLQRLGPAVQRAINEAEERHRRQIAEVHLRQNQELFRKITENVTDLIAVLDLEGKRVYLSPSYQMVIDLTGSWSGTDSFAEIHPEDRDKLRRIFHETVLTGAGQRAHYRFLLKDDRVRFMESQGNVIRDAQGNIVNVLVVSRDVTDRKIAEDRIREQAALLDKARDAIYVRDLKKQISFWNKAAERIYGWTAKEALGKSDDELLYREETFQLREARQGVLDKGEWVGELRQVTKSGKEISVESHRTLLLDEQGRPTSILNINTDITEKKTLEKQFLRTQRMESIGTLAGGIAHDLNNVLAPILMAIELLRMKLTDPSIVPVLDTLEASANRGANMVKQVLTFARGGETERVLLQLNHLIVEQIKIVREIFPPSIRVNNSIHPDLWTIRGDATQLHQILMNLCVNARDAMHNGGTLEITAENIVLDEQYARMQCLAKAGAYVVITVSDTGMGIPPEILDKIFDPFFTTKESGKGTGLGLSTVLGITKNHGGFVNVYSEVGKGSQIKIYLPAADPIPTIPDSAPLSNLPRGKGELILVADDEENIREITRETLETFGYRVKTAKDGIETIAVYAQYREDIAAVITDAAMPFMDGPAAIRALRRLNPEVRILAVSGMAQTGFNAEIVGAGSVLFLQKPFTTEELLTTVRKILDQAG